MLDSETCLCSWLRLKMRNFLAVGQRAKGACAAANPNFPRNTGSGSVFCCFQVLYISVRITEYKACISMQTTDSFRLVKNVISCPYLSFTLGQESEVLACFVFCLLKLSHGHIAENSFHHSFFVVVRQLRHLYNYPFSSVGKLSARLTLPFIWLGHSALTPVTEPPAEVAIYNG